METPSQKRQIMILAEANEALLRHTLKSQQICSLVKFDSYKGHFKNWLYLLWFLEGYRTSREKMFLKFLL